MQLRYGISWTCASCSLSCKHLPDFSADVRKVDGVECRGWRNRGAGIIACVWLRGLVWLQKAGLARVVWSNHTRSRAMEQGMVSHECAWPASLMPNGSWGPSGGAAAAWR